MTNKNATIDKLWFNIRSWFDENHEQKSHTTGFNSPATDSEINSLEKIIGLKLPEDFIQSYKVHNGVHYGIIADIGELLSISHIESTWLNSFKIMQDYDFSANNYQSYLDEFQLNLDGKIKPFPVWPKWLPLINQDGHTFWFVDLDPGEGGKLGQIIKVIDQQEWQVVADSFKDFLCIYEQALQNDEYVFDRLGNLVEKESLKEANENIALDNKLKESIEQSIDFDQIDHLSSGDLFTLVGIVTCEDYFINQINQYRDALKKTALFDRIILKTKKLMAPKLHKGEYFILVGDKHLKLSNPLGLDLSGFADEKVASVHIKVAKGNKYNLMDFKILK